MITSCTRRRARRGALRLGPGFAGTTFVLLVLVVLPRGTLAQEGCILGEGGRNDVVTRTLPGIGSITHIGGPHIVCEGSIEIFADSAAYYEDRRVFELIGNVRFLEEGRELQSLEARYFTGEGRLQAQGDVVLVDEEQGSRIEDGDLVYLPETDFRDEANITVTREADGTRPRAILTPPPPAPSDTAVASTPDPDVAPSDTASTVPPEPYRVVGDRIYMEGSGYFTASGDVEIERDSLFAFADSAEYDEAGGTLILEGSARVDGATYELTGRRITMTEPGGTSSRVRAEREARLTGEDVLLTAAQITVLLQDGALDRVVATPLARPSRAGVLPSMGDRAPRSAGPPAEESAPGEEVTPDSLTLERPEAFVQDFVLTADSLEVSAPGERLQRVFAAGSARSVSTARDSLNVEVLPPIAQNDWLEGDTVVIRFPGAPPVPPLRTVPDADTLPPEPALVPDLNVAPGDSAGGPEAPPTDTVPEAHLPAPDTVAEALEEPPDSLRPAVDTIPVPGGPVDTVQAPAGPGPPPERDVEPGVTARAEDSLQGPRSDDEATDPEEIIARGRARSLYRLPPNDSTFRAGSHPPAVHYVVGQEIRIRLEAGEVDEMRVTGQTRGVHLEPLRRAEPDSTAVGDSIPPTASGNVAPDTGAVLPDTGAAPPDTGRVVGAHHPSSDTPSHRHDPQQAARSAILVPGNPPWRRR